MLKNESGPVTQLNVQNLNDEKLAAGRDRWHSRRIERWKKAKQIHWSTGWMEKVQQELLKINDLKVKREYSPPHFTTACNHVSWWLNPCVEGQEISGCFHALFNWRCCETQGGRGGGLGLARFIWRQVNTPFAIWRRTEQLSRDRREVAVLSSVPFKLWSGSFTEWEHSRPNKWNR